ncbi:caspase domain-containing protein [Fusarium tricinctum]|uniref:Caspase domain-containing protein n=1 Tax=Fusarium tricinctum TaxID=61284 RepID=A0A8K0RPS3_9HYPO|nr:caspase domain-containing protein [Fusarium tricinctum]
MVMHPDKIFAVLIGIDDYLGEASNLYGCVNDVGIMQKSLESIGVQPGNISVLTSPPNVLNSTEVPTKDNVLRLIREVASKAAKNTPESLLVLHYSGHGAQVPTKHPKVKKGTDLDEVLCTLNEDISDVEMVDLLKELVEDKCLTVLVVLDCCHSGGADRAGATIRCRSPSTLADTESAARGVRNATIRDSWFYHDRDHTLIAACQPHELATEYCASDGKTYGAMTYHLVMAIKYLQSSKDPVTYEQLQSLLDSYCRAKVRQQPLLLGDRARIMFGKDNLASTVRSLQGSIVRVVNHSLILNKGMAHGVSLNDRFWIYPPTERLFGLLTSAANPVAEACVQQVRETQARAVIVDDPTVPEATPTSRPVGVGWCAQLKRSGNIPIVNLILSNTHNEGSQHARSYIQNEWKKVTDSAGPPVDLRFSSTATEPSLLWIEIHKDFTMSFQDRKRTPPPNIPTLKTTDGRIAQKLVSLLPHLCAYQRLVELTPKLMSWTPSYEFTITEYDNKDDDWNKENENSNSKSLAVWEIRFKNTGTVPIYLTILNLSPVYGISQMFPGQNASSCAVGVNKEIEPAIIDIEVPNLLRDAAKEPGFKMRDLIKAMITTEQTNFSHYLQADLESWKDLEGPLGLGPSETVGRGGRLRVSKVEKLLVDTKEIITLI